MAVLNNGPKWTIESALSVGFVQPIVAIDSPILAADYKRETKCAGGLALAVEIQRFLL